jgi:hypothetical protein
MSEKLIDTFPDLSMRTLMLLMGDFTQSIDKIEEAKHDDGEECFSHGIDRTEIERELARMIEYVDEHRSQFSDVEWLFVSGIS